MLLEDYLRARVATRIGKVKVSFTILTGKMYVWEEGHDNLLLAQQSQSVYEVNQSLSKGKLTVCREQKSLSILGLAMGKGSEPLDPIKLRIPDTGLPLFSCPIVCTTGRVQGLPGELGYFGPKNQPRSRCWIFSVNRELLKWQRALRLPMLWGVQPAVFRLAKSRTLRDVRTQIYREIRDGGKYRCH